MLDIFERKGELYQKVLEIEWNREVESGRGR
jgi:hypothetical protein